MRHWRGVETSDFQWTADGRKLIFASSSALDETWHFAPIFARYGDIMEWYRKTCGTCWDFPDTHFWTDQWMISWTFGSRFFSLHWCESPMSIHCHWNPNLGFVWVCLQWSWHVIPTKTRCSPRTRMQSRRTLLWNKLFEQSCTFFPCYRTSALYVWNAEEGGVQSVERGV